MKIGYVLLPERGALNRLLADLAHSLLAEGWALAGAVQHDIDCGPGAACDMDLQILPQGPVVRISQSLGAQSRGCRLDAAALEQAVALTEAQLDAQPPDLLILNKFGKHEGEGRGFRSTIAAALARDIPVLTGVNAANFAAFQDFTGGLAQDAGLTLAGLQAWVAAPRPS